MRSVYRQLALEHPHFGARFNDVDLWLSARESTGRLRSGDLTDNIRVLTGAELFSDAERSEGAEVSTVARSAHEFVQSMLSSAQIEDQQVAYQQETLLPKVFSDISRTLPTLPMAVRHARFLNPDGRTRTEIFWSIAPGAVHPPNPQSSEEYLVYAYARQLNPDYTLRRDTSRFIRIQGVQNLPDSSIPPQTTILEGIPDVSHAAMQWDQYRLLPEGRRERVRTATVWVDSLQALDHSGRAIEMSDLKPVLQEGEDTSRPYPFNEIGGDATLGLYFEVYHLNFDRSDQTRYTITYEITAARGQQASSVTSSYRGESRIARERISLDLSEFAGDVTVQVTVQDDVGGGEVSRTLDISVI